MLGGHFDSWQGGTGATNNGTGSSVAMEAARILATLHKAALIKPMARTVRVALWGGEEEGVYGSTAYVQQHFAKRTTMVKTPEYGKLDVYFNDDGGSGRFRGVSAGGSPEMAAIFKSWFPSRARWSTMPRLLLNIMPPPGNPMTVPFRTLVD